MLEHGGRLRQAAAHYRIPLADWLDLSTGISPNPYPLPVTPATVWQRLPEDDDDLEAAAVSYYGSSELLPVAGSQAAIQTLPAVLQGERVALLTPSYVEHAHAWRQHQCSFVSVADSNAQQLEQAVAGHDIVVLVHPNNPDGSRFSPARLREWRQQLAARGGWLVIDEAFIDTEPELSLCADAGIEGLIVLRSLGKFFGLAGARVGFVFAPASVRSRLAELLGPWTLSGPARWAARLALTDSVWQRTARQQLDAAGQRLDELLTSHGLGSCPGCALFRYLSHPQADALHDALARQGILVRLFTPNRYHQHQALRFGLPADEVGWARLDAGLRAALEEIR